jgi:hypothetical protein
LEKHHGFGMAALQSGGSKQSKHRRLPLFNCSLSILSWPYFCSTSYRTGIQMLCSKECHAIEKRLWGQIVLNQIQPMIQVN